MCDTFETNEQQAYPTWKEKFGYNFANLSLLRSIRRRFETFNRISQAWRSVMCMLSRVPCFVWDLNFVTFC